MMKEQLEQALNARLNAAAELQDLIRFDAETGEELARLSAVLTLKDLQDESRFAKISRLQTARSLTPQVHCRPRGRQRGCRQRVATGV